MYLMEQRKIFTNLTTEYEVDYKHILSLVPNME